MRNTRQTHTEEKKKERDRWDRVNEQINQLISKIMNK
jgi:hypothetical protein